MSGRVSPRFSVGILAGGKSSRMGQNKALMEFQNETMIGRISKAFMGSREVLISAAERGLYEAPGVRVVYDEADSIGPIEGIRRLLTEAEEEYVFICAADMPFVSREIAEYIAEFISSDYDCYVVADKDRVHPLLAIYSKRVLPVIEELIRRGRYRLMDILNGVRTKYIRLEHTDFDRRVVRNINTRDEFLRLSLPAFFAVSGYHNSGKTGLIEKLINEFIHAGYTVGVIKHDGQDHIKRAEGTDTDRYHRAGAGSSIILSDSGFLLEAERPRDSVKMKGTLNPEESMNPKGALDPEESRNGVGSSGDMEFCLQLLQGLPEPPDIMILEGFKSARIPRIEVVRREVVPQPVTDPEMLICIVTDCISPEEVTCPVFGAEDIQGIFSCLREHFHI